MEGKFSEYLLRSETWSSRRVHKDVPSSSRKALYTYFVSLVCVAAPKPPQLLYCFVHEPADISLFDTLWFSLMRLQSSLKGISCRRVAPMRVHYKIIYYPSHKIGKWEKNVVVWKKLRWYQEMKETKTEYQRNGRCNRSKWREHKSKDCEQIVKIEENKSFVFKILRNRSFLDWPVMINIATIKTPYKKTCDQYAAQIGVPNN